MYPSQDSRTLKSWLGVKTKISTEENTPQINPGDSLNTCQQFQINYLNSTGVKNSINPTSIVLEAKSKLIIDEISKKTKVPIGFIVNYCLKNEQTLTTLKKSLNI